MTMKKVIIGWLALCVLIGGWSLVSGNDTEEGRLKNDLADLCEEAFKANEGTLRTKFLDLAMEDRFKERTMSQPLMLKVEYDDDIEPVMEAKRGVDRRELNLSCQQTLASNYTGVDPVVVITVHVNKNGNVSYEVSDYDLYDTKNKVWWSQL